MKIFLVLIISILFLSFVSATFKSDFEEALNNEVNLPVIVPQDYCSSFIYKFYSKLFNGAVIQIVDKDTKETFYLVLYVQEECIWDVNIEDSHSKADLIISGYLDGRETEIKSNTFKGFLIKNTIKEIL